MLSALTPLIIGFFSGFHCIAMCGGLCAVLCQHQNKQQILLTNLGRVITYTLLGALFAGLVQGLSLQLDLASWGGFLRLLMGSMLVLAGLALVLKDRGKWLVIQKPLPFWPQVSQQLKRLQQARSTPAIVAKGMLWGLIPCGLLYAMLVIAATTADVMRGASFMLFFGLGTVLPLFFSQLAVRKITSQVQSGWMRHAAGGFVMVLGLWVLLAPYGAHWLIPENNVFFTEIAAVLSMCIP